MPLAAEKLEGPSDCLTFLGIEIDMRAGQLRLPSDKLSCLRDLLACWYPVLSPQTTGVSCWHSAPRVLRREVREGVPPSNNQLAPYSGRN